MRKFALADLERRGWKVAHAIHSIFNASGQDSGKIIFLGTDPERTYDIAWYHNPDVVIQPNTQDTKMKGNEGSSEKFFLLRLSVIEAELRLHDFVRLDDDDIARVLDAIKDFDIRSPYNWRMVPTR